jgi:hypothetical protein
MTTLPASIEKAIDELSSCFKIGRPQARTFMDPTLTVLTEHFCLDIIKLDDWLHAQGYKEKTHGSMKDYIKLTYGPEACMLVLRLIKL